MPTTISQLGILLRHSLPLCLGASLQYLISLTSIFSVGHIGTDQLSAVALSAMFANVTAFSIGFGASSALETLCSQAFTLEPATLGHHLNRSILVMIVFTLPVTILWLYMEKLMLLLGQEAQVAYFAGEYILVLVPGILPVLIFECMKRFLQAQGIMSGVFVVVSFSAPINIFLQWLFIGPFDLGFRGAALATCVTYYLQPIILFVYAKFFTTGLHHYHGWNWKQVFDTEKLMLFLKLAIPGAAMICSESWAFELVTLSASMLGSTALAAQVVAMTSINVAFMLPLGMGAAVSTMIGNSLGANKPDISRSIRNAAILGALLTVSSTCAFFMLVRNQWGSIFTGDQEVITIVSQILPIASVFQFFDGVNVVIGGLLRGTGHQKIGAVCNLVGYYVIGLPLAAFFAFELKLGLFGLWAGISIALLCVSGLSFFWIMTIDWKVECEKAAIRCEESVGLLVEGDP